MDTREMNVKSKEQAKEEIISLHSGIMTAARRSVQDAIKIGQIISEQKKQLQHGEFLPWVEGLPISQQTTSNYMRLYNHSNKLLNIGNLQEAYKQIESFEHQQKQTEEQRKRSMIAEYRKTGIKPDGWDRSLDYVIQKDKEQAERQKAELEKIEQERQKRKEEREQQQQAQDIFSSVLEKATNEIFEKHAEKEQWQDKIKLSDNGKDNAFMDAIIEYLDTLDDDNRRIEACYNIIKICKNIAITLQQK